MQPIPVPAAKRAFDIVASSIVIVALTPVVGILVLLSVIEQILRPSTRGPLFYREIRISQGKPFYLRKIRTLKSAAITDARAVGMVHTKQLENTKGNFTFVGAILHRIYLDESPQLLSVFMGDMSFVGPRPTNVFNYETDVANGLQAKKILRAGLTGRFQTHKHVKYKLNQEEVDMEYARLLASAGGVRIVLHDILILLQTVITVFRAEGL